MNIVILNNSANVGKTIVGKYLLQPRLDNDYISVKTLIKDDYDTVLSADNFEVIQDEVLSNNNIIVDVSNSHTPTFFRQMAIYKGSHEDYNYFIVPVTPEVKAINETRQTLETLIKLGVDSTKIRLIFNKVLSQNHSVEQIELKELKALATEYNIHMPSTALYVNEIFPNLEKYNLNFFKVLSDEMSDNFPKDSHATFVQANGMHKLVKNAQANMDAVFSDLALVK